MAMASLMDSSFHLDEPLDDEEVRLDDSIIMVMLPGGYRV
jgi:hypothetical protein